MAGGRANGQPAARSIRYLGTAETAPVAVRVSDTSHSSIAMASTGRPRGGLAVVVRLFGGRIVIAQLDDSVIVALIENFRSVHHAVA